MEPDSSEGGTGSKVESAEVDTQEQTEQDGTSGNELTEIGSTKENGRKISNSSQVNIIPCRICKTGFPSREQFSNHMESSHPDEPVHECSPCQLQFSTGTELSSHMSSHHPATHPPPELPPFICTACGKKFLLKSDMEEHKNTHDETSATPPKSPVRPFRKTGMQYSCSECDQLFPVPSLLQKHMIIHNQANQCPRCPQKFISVQALNLHKRLIHDTSGMTFFKCIFCSKSDFLLVSDLYSHRLEEHSKIPYQFEKEKPFGCGVCKKPFQRKGDALVCSVLAHDPSTLLQSMFLVKCPECPADLGYHSIKALKKHWLDNHSSPFPQDKLREDGYPFDLSLPRIHIDKQSALDIKENGFPDGESSLPPVIEFPELARDTNINGRCKIPEFACPDCSLTFADVDSLRIHEQVHLNGDDDAQGAFPSPRKSDEATAEPAQPISLPKQKLPLGGPPPSTFIRGQHLVAKFGCLVCGQKFRKLKRLRDHEQTHLNMDPNCPTFPKIPGRGGRKAGGALGLKKRAINVLNRGKRPITISSPSLKPEPDYSEENVETIKLKPFKCTLCPSTFSVAKSLRMHELNRHNAPHRKPGRRPGTPRAAENPSKEDDKPLAPGRMRVGRLEISTKLNKMVKQYIPIKISVTNGDGQTVFHYQCPLCPKIFRDKRGIHLHSLGHSMAEGKPKGKDSEDDSEGENGSRTTSESSEEVSSEGGRKIGEGKRRTSYRERKIPKKWMEYEVDEEEAPGISSQNSETSPGGSIKEINGNDNQSRRPSLPVLDDETWSSSSDEEDYDFLNDTDSEDGDEDEQPPPPVAPPEQKACKDCGMTFETVTELWYHGNSMHSRSTKVKVIRPGVPKPSQPQAEPPKAPARQVPKKPAFLALVEKKRKQAGRPVTPSSPVKDVKKRRKPVANPAPVINDGVRRIGQLKIPANVKNSEVFRHAKPEIITKHMDNGTTVTIYKCPDCPRTFKDKRGFPFHYLCHMVTSDKLLKSPLVTSPTQKQKIGMDAAAAKVVKQMPALIPLKEDKDKNSLGAKEGITSPPGSIRTTAMAGSLTKNLLKPPTSENTTPPKVEVSGEKTTPGASQNGDEFKFKIVKKSVILPFEKKRPGRQPVSTGKSVKALKCYPARVKATPKSDLADQARAKIKPEVDTEGKAILEAKGEVPVVPEADQQPPAIKTESFLDTKVAPVTTFKPDISQIPTENGTETLPGLETPFGPPAKRKRPSPPAPQESSVITPETRKPVGRPKKSLPPPVSKPDILGPRNRGRPVRKSEPAGTLADEHSTQTLIKIPSSLVSPDIIPATTATGSLEGQPPSKRPRVRTRKPVLE